MREDLLKNLRWTQTFTAQKIAVECPDSSVDLKLLNSLNNIVKFRKLKIQPLADIWKNKKT